MKCAMFEKTLEILIKINNYFVLKQVQKRDERWLHKSFCKENTKNYYRKGKNIRFYFTYLVSFFVISGFYGCDVCNVGESKDNDATDIFFSALPLNGDTSSIFAVSTDGSGLRKIANDGVLYSGPSRNKTIVFLKEHAPVDTLLYYMKTNGDSLDKSTITSAYNLIANPIMSPDGRNVAIFIGNRQLILVGNMIFVQWASFNFCEETIPSFSPDGRYIAFYEGSSLSGPLTVKVVSTNDPNNVIYHRDFSFGINPWKGETGIDWSADSRIIVYMLSDSGSDIINIDEISGGKSNQLIISGIVAFMPVLSPDKSTVAFSARDGNIWLETIVNERNYKLTDADTTMEYNLYPQWTSDGKNIFYTHFFKDEAGNKFGGNLEIIDVRSLRRMVLSNNVFRGFIMKMMTQ
jgi:hypothetical protein